MSFDEETAAILLEGRRPVEAFAHRERRDGCDVATSDRHRERFGLEPFALADRARPLAHVALDVRADEVGGRFTVLAVEPRKDAFPLVFVGAPLPVAVLVRELESVLGAVQDRVDRLFGQ